MKNRLLISLIVLVFVFILASEAKAISSISQKEYPQLKFSGYKKWYYSKIEVAPAINYFPALEDSLFQSNLSNRPWTENLNLFILGEMTDRWQFQGNLWQLEGIPDSYNVGMLYKGLYLSWGEQKQLLADQEFLFQDRVIGIGMRQNLFGLELSLVSGNYLTKGLVGSSSGYTAWKEFRSRGYAADKGSSYYLDNPELEYLGLDLERIDIVKESVEVSLDGRLLIRDADFLVDTDYGLVLVPRTYSGAKKAKVVYKLMNGKKREQVFDFQKEAKRRAFLSPEFRIIDGSETMTVDGQKKDRDLDYKVNYNLGLFVMREPLHEDADVRIDYDYTYGPGLFASETITGQIGSIINLSHEFLVEGSETLVKNGQLLSRDIDYDISYSSGRVDLTQALTATDTLEATYSYLGLDRSVSAVNVEYELSPWNKIGCSLVELRSDFGNWSAKNSIPDISASTYNLYGQATINRDTFIRAEVASSKMTDITPFTSNTHEADSALIITGRTRFAGLELDGTYRKIGLNFSSIRKIKSNIGWKDVKSDVRVKYSIFDNLFVKAKFENSTNQLGTTSSPEVKSEIISTGFGYRYSNYWDLDWDFRTEKQASSSFTGTTLLQTSLYAHQRLDIDEIFPAIKGFADKMDLICKNLLAKKNGEINQGVLVNTDENTQKLDIGWLSKYKCGVSSYILWSIENGKDNNAGTSYDRVTPLYRLSYLWDLGEGQNLEISYDYSSAQQRGSTDYDKIGQGYSLIWKYPVDNPILSEMRFEATSKITDYTDLGDPSNNYQSTTTYLQGALVF